jgi:hypothetical protein
MLTPVLDARLALLGFRPKRRYEWTSTSDQPAQRIALSVRKVRGTDTCYVEAFVGVHYPELEALCARLQGKALRKGFFTCSLNVGLLTPKKSMIEWPFTTETDPSLLATTIADVLEEVAPPFFRDFASLTDVLRRFRHHDRRICVGMDWTWKQAAVEALLGHRDEAINTLQAIARAVPTMQASVDSAIAEVRRRATPP